MNGTKLLAGAISAAVLAAVVAGIVVLDPPGIQRSHKLDEQRVRHLSNLAEEIDQYWSKHKVLPSDLATLASLPGQHLNLKDPVSGMAYEFKPGKDADYALCAGFERASPDEARFYAYGGVKQWRHDAGQTCFARNAAKKTTCNND